jgi:hypothetical protein
MASLKKLTEREAGRIEGYALALDQMLGVLAESKSGKSCDPMTVDGATMHSYAFDMKNGGRQHPISDYESVDEILAYLLSEALDDLDQARTGADAYGVFAGGCKGIRLYSDSYIYRRFPHARSPESEEIQAYLKLTDRQWRDDYTRIYDGEPAEKPSAISKPFEPADEALWQPIETAPLDGTRIIVRLANGSETFAEFDPALPEMGYEGGWSLQILDIDSFTGGAHEAELTQWRPAPDDDRTMTEQTAVTDTPPT